MLILKIKKYLRNLCSRIYILNTNFTFFKLLGCFKEIGSHELYLFCLALNK